MIITARDVMRMLRDAEESGGSEIEIIDPVCYPVLNRDMTPEEKKTMNEFSTNMMKYFAARKAAERLE